MIQLTAGQSETEREEQGERVDPYSVTWRVQNRETEEGGNRRRSGESKERKSG